MEFASYILEDKKLSEQEIVYYYLMNEKVVRF